jgi:2-polyprenyl-3-methyl-5-hydroxy-6-metoxy-1,4-benzoquinol methylase
MARELVRPRAGGRLIDYGCGDGTFVAMVHDEFRQTLGVDVEPGQIAECRRRLGHLPGVHFETLGESHLAERQWDVVACMEVLEHCLEPERRRVIDALAMLAAPAAFIVISVPIEIGPSLLVKQCVRAFAGWRRLGDYEHRERYTGMEIVRAAAGARLSRVVLEGQAANGTYRYYGHKGFDYRDLQAELSSRMRIVRRTFTPVRWLGPVLNSQAWFVCAPL